MHGTNCIAFAVRLWWRRRHKAIRCYVAWRRSDWGRFPHAVYCERLPSGRVRMVSYKPIDPRRKALPPPLFAGRVEWGDK